MRGFLVGLLLLAGMTRALAQPPAVATDADRSRCTASVTEARTRADKGDPAGFLALGKFAFFGICLAPDPAAARRYLQKAADLGIPCAPAVMETVREPGIGDAALARAALFRRCAFALTQIENRQIAQAATRRLLAPGQVPMDLKAEIDRLYDLVEHSPDETFALARGYVGKENGRPLRQAAMFWLTRLATVKTPVTVQAQYFLGTLAFGGGADLVKKSDGETWLHMAAKSGQIPAAQRDYARRLLRRGGDKHDRIIAYAWLLVARRNGLDVSKDLADAGQGLSDLDLDVARRISFQDPPS